MATTSSPSASKARYSYAYGWEGGVHDIRNNNSPRFALKLTPERNEELRERHSSITPAWHWNKKHWSDVHFEETDDSLTAALINESYNLIISKLPKAIRTKYSPQ